MVINQGGSQHWRRDPRGRAVVNSVGNSIVVDPDAYAWGDAASVLPNWNEMIIYEMHVGTFNDPTLANGTPATFYDAAQKLDHLADLGINMVELLPINEFPGDYSWGYNPAEVFAVESVYGGVEALRHFVDEAHQRNIGVILDVVYNHLGPNDLSLWQFDGWNVNNLGGIYFYQDGRANTPWGNTRPDYGRSEVRWFFGDANLMWLDECHIDGFRWDATAYIRNVYGNDNDPANDINDGWGMMQDANNRLEQAAPWAISIAEDMKGNAWLTKTTGEGGAGFDSQWDPGFVHPMRAAIIEASDANRNMWSIYDLLVRKDNNDAFKRVIYTESHDEDANGKKRVPSEIDNANPGSVWARKRSTLGAGVLLTTPGIPMLFQGQEILESGWFHDDIPVDWSKKTTYSGIFQMYKDLVALRKNAAGATRGLTGQNINVFHVNDFNKVIAYHRWDNGGVGDDVVVLANFGAASWPDNNYRIGFPRGGTWNVLFNSDSTQYSADFGNVGSVTVNAEAVPYNGLAYSGTVSFGPYSVVILSQATGGPVDEAPSAGITSPASGATVDGNVTIAASALDDNGVVEVRFYVAGTLVGTDTTDPYSYSWDSTTVANGNYTVQATAVDTIGQTGSDSLSVTVNNVVIDNPPSVSVTAPANSATVSDTVSITASAGDDNGVTEVRFYVNGNLVATDTSSPYVYSWDSTTVPNGGYSIDATAEDTAGQTSSDSITVTVDNVIDLPPTVSVSAPANGATVSGMVDVTASASDDNGVTEVRFYIGGVLFATDTTAPYGFSWDTAQGENASYTVQAIAEDAMGQTAQETINVDVSNVVSYQSGYNSMTLAASFTGWNPAANNMTLVADYTWEVEMYINKGSGQEFKFTANGNWNDNWGDNNQSDFRYPMTASAEYFGANIRSSRSLRGTFRFTFNEQTLVYKLVKL